MSLYIKMHNKSVWNHYRPIVILPAASKKNWTNEINLLTISPNLNKTIPLQTNCHICEALDKKKEIGIVFYDISKAFDKCYRFSLGIE